MQLFRLDMTEDERKALVALIDQAVRANGITGLHVASHLLRRLEHATPVQPPEPEPAAEDPAETKEAPKRRARRGKKVPEVAEA